MSRGPLRMGTRGSALARGQSATVADAVTRATGLPVEVVIVRTEGDHLSTEGRAPQGSDEVGVFTRALDEALREDRIDFAVHSLKDVPTEPAGDLLLAAVPERADARDALVLATRHGLRGVTIHERRSMDEAEETGANGRRSSVLDTLPRGAVVATASPRRIAQLRRLRPDLRTAQMIGNVDTRLSKLERGDADALLLASAGLDRLGRGEVITVRLPEDVFLPAPAQGALAVACRAADAATCAALAHLDHPASRAAALAERAVLHHLRGGCRAPVGAHATVRDGVLTVAARVLSLDGSESLESAETGREPEELGRRLAERLLAMGAARLIAAARSEGAPSS